MGRIAVPCATSRLYGRHRGENGGGDCYAQPWAGSTSMVPSLKRIVMGFILATARTAPLHWKRAEEMRHAGGHCPSHSR